jgi:hypothetical protein
MAAKKENSKKTGPETIDTPAPVEPPRKVLTSQQEVIEELRMSQYQFETLLKKYPFYHSGAAGKLNGRWHVAVEDVWRWHRYVQQQERRHPDARRMRPEEPPDIADIRARA